MFKVLTVGLLLVVVCGGAIAQENQAPGCPMILVTTQAHIPTQGELFEFSAEIKGSVPKRLTYHWTVSKGAIVEGQGTTTIKVFADWRNDSNLTTTLEVIGLPKVCPNLASESVPIVDLRESVLVDEFSAPPPKLEKERFKFAVMEQKNNPTDKLYIIEYFRKSTPSFDIREKKNRLREFLIKEMKLDESFFTIVTETADKPLTKIYRIPPGAHNPVP